jgi:hypothetical protein
MGESNESPLYPTPEHHPHGGVIGFDRSQVQKVNKEPEAHAIYEDQDGKRVLLNKEIPYNHKWFAGEFHFSPWGDDISTFGGRTEGRVRVSIMGDKIEPTIRHGIASVYGVVTAVMDEKDRHLIRQSGWWRLEDRSKTGRKTTGRNS